MSLSRKLRREKIKVKRKFRDDPTRVQTPSKQKQEIRVREWPS